MMQLIVLGQLSGRGHHLSTDVALLARAVLLPGVVAVGQTANELSAADVTPVGLVSKLRR